MSMTTPLPRVIRKRAKSCPRDMALRLGAPAER